MYNIVHVRVDDRLVHGQVANRWCGFLDVRRIIVASDELCKNELLKTAYRVAVPSGVSSSFLGVDDVVRNLNSGKYGDSRLLLLVSCPCVVERLVLAGVRIDCCNIGNLSKRDECVKIRRSVWLTSDEYGCVLRLIEMGVKVTLQMVPDEKLELFECVV